MGSTTMCITLELLVLVTSITTSCSSPLDNLNVNPATLGVSGFSSGGCFATQFHTAFSQSISGVGSFSGCPYISAYLDNDEDIITETLILAEQGLIDSIENLVNDKIFIFQGLLDTIVPWPQAGRIHHFYSQFTKEENIVEKSDLDSEHGFPSDSYGGECNKLNGPFYINNCHYNGAANVIKHEIGSINVEDGDDLDELTTFDQNEFYDNAAQDKGMANKGYVFIPSKCVNGSNECHLHVHFHGCAMQSGWIGDNYIQHNGFLSVAEANDVIMIFPQISEYHWSNPNGCWDWWGYLMDADNDIPFQYATKMGRQMRGIALMIERTSGVNMY